MSDKMDTCFKHVDKAAIKDCMYCGKGYCEECLLLHGETKTVICKDCYNIYQNRIKKSNLRRVIYIISAILVSIYFLLTVFGGLTDSESSDSIFNIFIVLILLFTSIFNYIRIRQTRKWLQTEEYQSK
jgi:uncharacterized membrane protein YesL